LWHSTPVANTLYWQVNFAKALGIRRQFIAKKQAAARKAARAAHRKAPILRELRLFATSDNYRGMGDEGLEPPTSTV
jgi:hypothetical protein